MQTTLSDDEPSGPLLLVERSHRIVFVLLEGFSLLALGGILDVLNSANRQYKTQLFTWDLQSATKECIGFVSSTPNRNLNDWRMGNITLFVGSELVWKGGQPDLISKVRKYMRESCIVGAVGNAVELLAEAGVLEGKCVAGRFDRNIALAELYSNTRFYEFRFHVDGRIWSCPGGIAAIDFALAIVSHLASRDVANSVASSLLHKRADGGSDGQRPSICARFGIRHGGLLRAISYIENLGDLPLRSAELAKHVGLSIRQLERLFRAYSNLSPKQFDRRRRLERGRALLQHTQISISEVSMICGFINAAHFSQSYRSVFGETPSTIRTSNRINELPSAALIASSSCRITEISLSE